MKIFVKAKPNAKEDRDIPLQAALLGDGKVEYMVWTKEKPVDGRANEAIAKLLAEYFKVPRFQVRLTRGATLKKKVFEIG